MTIGILGDVNAQNPLLKLLVSGPCSGAELARRLGVSRQAVNKRLRALVLGGLVSRTGATRGAVFTLAGKEPGRETGSWTLSRRLSLSGLSEDKVFEQIAREVRLQRILPENVVAILRYAFTEMLNPTSAVSPSDVRIL